MAHGHPVAATLSLPLSGLLMFFARDRRARMETAVELSGAYRGTALLLGDVVEADDAYTGSHSRDVVELSMSVGPMLGLDAEQLRRLEFAALLHDVGKIAIPKSIINKPGALDAEERADHRDPHGRGRDDAQERGGPARRGGDDRALLPRALRRTRVSRSPGRRGDPGRGAHRGLL